MLTTEFIVLWGMQFDNQVDLGLDPDEMNDVKRASTLTELTALLHEEASELGRLGSSYKRHLAFSPEPDRAQIAEEVADALKTLLAIAQTHRLTPGEVVDAFKRKTDEIEGRAKKSAQITTKHNLVCVDLDDVVVDARVWREELNGSIQNIESAPDRLRAAEDFKNGFYAGGRFRDLAPIPGAVEALQTLQSEGFKIAIITARPQWQYKRLYGDTVDWLKRHQVPYDALLFNKDKVEALYEHIVPSWPIFFVEDHEKNAKALASAGVKVLLFDQPHNEDVSAPNVKRVFNWTEILNIALGKPNNNAHE